MSRVWGRVDHGKAKNLAMSFTTSVLDRAWKAEALRLKGGGVGSIYASVQSIDINLLLDANGILALWHNIIALLNMNLILLNVVQANLVHRDRKEVEAQQGDCIDHL